jgi:hypothetical protein
MQLFTRIQLLRACSLSLAVTILTAVLLTAQQPAEKSRSISKLGPGVLTVIAPRLEEEETVSRIPFDQIRRQMAFEDWSPSFAASTRRLIDRARKARLRRPVWGLEFTFKPFRLVQVDIPQATGKMQRKIIWYMVYRVRYLGFEIHPKIEQTTTLKEDQSPGESTFTKFLPDRRDVDARRFIPQFVLRNHATGIEYLDRVIPAALDEIQKRERLVELYNTVEMPGVKIPISEAKTGKGVWGVVTWEDLDPRIDFFSVYIQGLTNAYRFRSVASPQIGKRMEFKTLQLNFSRPGDTVAEHEEEFRYGIPDNPIQTRLTHLIEKGDSLAALAKRYLGDETRANDLFDGNRDVLSQPDRLPEGQVLRIPTVDFKDLEPASKEATEPYSVRQRKLFSIYGVTEQVPYLWLYRPGTLEEVPVVQ